MYGARFEKELSLVEAALEGDKEIAELKKYLTPFVDLVINENKKKWREVQNLTNASLREVAWTHLSLAIKKYLGRAELMMEGKNDIYYFSTYFAWYVRQAIIEYINTQKRERE